MVSRFSRWPPRWPFRIAEWNYFSNCGSLCHSHASHQVSAQSDLWFGRRCRLKNFKMAASHLGYRNRTILAILNLYVGPMPLIKFRLNLTYGLGGDVIRRISRWPVWRPSWISEWNDFNKSESLSHCQASHQVSAQSYLWLGSRCRLKNFKMGAMVAILDIRTERF